MANIYAMSDIHGFYESMQQSLELIDLSEQDNKLILCGDFIDYGPDSCKVLYTIKQLMERYPSQVVAIKGNHETMFLEFLYAKEQAIWNVEWLGTDRDFSTVNSFITDACKEKMKQIQANFNYPDSLFDAAKLVKEDILTQHKELIQWLSHLPFIYETKTQIFVHAGIDEEAEEFWKYGTPDDYFVSKFPATFGPFYKDIIAGHISTSSLAKDKDFHHVFWDGESHFFIDGETNVSGQIPILKYDTTTSAYSSFKRTHIDGAVQWREYVIKS